MQPTARFPRQAACSYHNYRGNNINDPGSKSGIIFEVNDQNKNTIFQNDSILSILYPAHSMVYKNLLPDQEEARNPVLHWLSDHRRKKLTELYFPSAWEDIIRRNVAHYCMLDAAEQDRLRALIQVFIAEKYWEGCGGLELTDEIRVTISAQACLLLLDLPHDYYRNVHTILVYPSTVVPPQRKLGHFETAIAPLEIAHPILGQAFQQGPLILIWDAALQGGRHPELGHNVIYHEFAHKLDMLDGAADGTPPLRDRDEYRDWVAVCSREYLRLKSEVKAGKKSFLSAYGATNEAEFFSVATEEFFDRPLRLKEHSPDLYRVLKEYYRQDPAVRVGRNTCINA